LTIVALFTAIEVDSEQVPYAIAGANATLFLSGIDPLQLSIGTVLCPPSLPIPVVSSFLAQIIVFEPKYPITAGYAVELFHHSKDIPASIARLDATLDRTTGQVLKSKPRYRPTSLFLSFPLSAFGN
jgi:elongation factor 1 alpha-like protein